MFVPCLVIFCVYLLITGFEYWLDWLNYRHLKANGSRVPEEFSGHIDETLLSKTMNYTVDKMRFELVSSGFDEILELLFIFGGLLSLYNSWILSFNYGFIWTGLFFFIAISVIKTFLGIPFSIFSTFKIENKYGFNTMTRKLWMADFFKSLVISIIIMSVLTAISLWLINTFPKTWWLNVWGFFFVFSLFFMYISPYVLEPLFNKFTPLDDEELVEKIRKVLAGSGIKVGRVFKMDASKRTKHSNAYFTGIGNVKRIVLYDTILETMNHDEIVAILAHEAGHWKKRHLIKNLILFELLSFVGAYLAFLVLKSDLLPEIFYISTKNSFFAKLVLLSFVASIVTYPFSPIFNLLSRFYEKEADDFACALTGDGEALASSLIKLSKENLANLQPHPLYAWFHYSHPSAPERIKYLRSKRS